jgi:hypothetical protein
LAAVGTDQGGFTASKAVRILASGESGKTGSNKPASIERQIGEKVKPPWGGEPWLVSRIDNGRAIAFCNQDETWSMAFSLQPIAAGVSRLTTRIRSTTGGNPVRWLAQRIFQEPIYAVLGRTVIMGIKDRAEALTGPVDVDVSHLTTLDDRVQGRAAGELALQEYLDLLEDQVAEIYREISGLNQEELWRRPAPDEWSIGENLDHSRVIYSSLLPYFRWIWKAASPIARLFRDRPYAVRIDNVYLRPGFPQNIGWLWPAKNDPEHPASLQELRKLRDETDKEVLDFYRDKRVDVLGHIPLFDPAIGWLNLIQALQSGLYHDQLHFDHIREMLADRES